MFRHFIWYLSNKTKSPFATPYFSSLGVPVWHKKSNRAAAAKESQEILIGVATHLAYGSNNRISEKQTSTFSFSFTYEI